jgi:hypothetical protein
MQIKLNEQDFTADENALLGTVRDRTKADADVLIVNGFPASEETRLNDGDHVVLIKRGEIPGEEELDALLDRVKRALREDDYELIKAMAETIAYLVTDQDK